MTVPNRMHLSWNNDIGEYTIASDVAAETAYPLTNMQNGNANDPTVLDMTADTAVVITGSDATERTATCFAIHNHNMPADNTIRLRLFDAVSQGGTTVYDSAATQVPHTIPWGSSIAGVDPYGSYFEALGNMKTHFSLWFDSVAYKSFQIDIAATTSTDNTLSIDKLWLGFAYAPEYGPEHGTNSTQQEDSQHQRKPGGGMETIEGHSRRILQILFRGVENYERHVIRNILDRSKKGGDLLITMDPNDARSQNYERTSIYRRTSNVAFVDAYYNGNDFGLSVEEN